MFVEKSSKRSMNIIQKKSTFSCSFESRQTRIKPLRQRDSRDTVMLARKQFKRNLNAIRKRMRSSLFSMFNQAQITSYFKFADQSNSTSIKSIKFSTFISCFNSTSRVCFSVNQNARTSHIALETNLTSLIKSRIKTRASVDSSESRYLVVADVDHINKDIRVETSLTNAKRYNSVKSSIKSTEKFKSIKFSTFISCFSSTSRVCFSINQDARTSHIALETNFTSLIKSIKALNLETQQKIKNCFSFRFLRQWYIVVADVDYINIDIRVETSLTTAKEYNSVKSSIKSIEKLKSSSKLSSTPRICFSINQVAETSQYQHIAIDKAKLFKSLKSTAIINSFNSTLRFSFSINHDSIISQMLISMFSRIDFLRVLINQQMIYVSINSRLRRFRQRYIAVVVVFICI